MPFESKYRYPKMNKARSYRDEVVRRIELMKLAGAKLELKEYTSRPPSKYADRFDIDGAYLRNSDSVFVTVLSNKKLVTATLVTREFWYETVKTTDRERADDMQALVDNLLNPLETYANDRAS